MARFVFPLVLATSLVAVSCTIKRQGSNAQSNEVSLNTVSDSELFQANSNVPPPLQQEIKRQFLAAVSMSEILREHMGSSGELLLKEIGIARTHNVVIDIDAMGDGRAQVKSVPQEGTPSSASNGQLPASGGGPVASCPAMGSNSSSYNNSGSSYNNTNYGATNGPSPISAGVGARYRVQESSYNVSFAFVDKTKGPDGEVFRFHLRSPLEVEENFCVAARARLSFSGIKALPPNVATIVARFIDDITLAIDAGMAYQRTADLSTRMFFRPASGFTPLMSDFLNDVIQPLCTVFAQRSGKPAGTCQMAIAPSGDLVANLSQRFVPSLRGVARCMKTNLSENTLPLYKFYFAVPAGAQVYTAGSKAFVYERAEGGWKRIGWATVEGGVERANCGDLHDSSICMVAKYGAHWFDRQCSDATAEDNRLALHYEDKAHILEGDVGTLFVSGSTRR